MIALLLKLALGGLNFVKLVGEALRRFFAALDIQGWLGLAASLLLAFAWLHAAGDARHWQKQSGQFEKLYAAERGTLAQTIANYRAAAEQARQADAANAARVAAEQAKISKEQSDEYEKRIAAARALAERLRDQLEAAAHSGGSAKSSVPVVSSAPSGSDQAPGQDGFSLADRLTATEQSIQLDELIKWVRQQHAVRVDGMSGERPDAAGRQAAVATNQSN